MEFKPVTGADIHRLGYLQPAGWPDIMTEFEYYLKKDFCHPMKVVSGNTVMGLGVSIHFKTTCWLAHIIVHEDHRNRGIGFQITEKLLHDQATASTDTILLISTELGFPVYKKAGFRVVTEYTYLMRDRPWGDLQISPAIIPYEKGFYSEIMALDLQITGEDRRQLLADYLNNAYVFIENSSIKGLYLPELGEGPILADNENAGIELMKKKYAAVDKAVLPSDNKAGIEFLLGNGFELSATKGTRMIKGKDIQWFPQKIFSRIGGNYG
jgi:GNAT superfamily N-acetyltransferase